MRSRRPGIDLVLRNSGAQLAELRRSAGLSQAELAERAGIHTNTVSNIERAIGDPSVLAMSLIQVHLGSSGVLVESDGFITLPPGCSDPDCTFPASALAPSRMMNVMGDCLRSRRRGLGLTLEELASETGLHLNTIWNFERGLVVPSVTTVWSLYRRLGVRLVARKGNSIMLT